MNYQVIVDEAELAKFVNNFLPVLENHEMWYVGCYARNKYCAGVANIKSDKQSLGRFTSVTKRLIEKLRQLEVPMNAYLQKDVIVPQEALCVYLTINPRDLKLAGKNALIKLADLVTREYNGYNPHQEVMSEIQKAKSRTCFVDFDFDITGDETRESIVESILTKVNKECVVNILYTRGGLHCLIDPTKVDKSLVKTWYKNIASMNGVDVKGDNMIPIPGCYQGGYVPKLVMVEGEWQ